MRVVIKEPGKPARAENITPGLKTLQDIVHGRIEAFYPFNRQVSIIVNEEGKLNNLQPNFVLLNEGDPCDVIVGTAVFVGLGVDNFASIDNVSEEKIINILNSPEQCCIINDKLLSVMEITDFE